MLSTRKASICMCVFDVHMVGSNFATDFLNKTVLVLRRVCQHPKRINAPQCLAKHTRHKPITVFSLLFGLTLLSLVDLIAKMKCINFLQELKKQL